MPDGEQYIAFQNGVLGLYPLPGVPPESRFPRPWDGQQQWPIWNQLGVLRAVVFQP